MTSPPMRTRTSNAGARAAAPIVIAYVLISIGWLALTGAVEHWFDPWKVPGLVSELLYEIGVLFLSSLILIWAIIRFNGGLTMAGQQLRHRMVRDRHLLESLPSGVLELNRHGEVVHCNHLASVMLSTPKDDLIGAPLLDLLPEEPAAAMRASVPLNGDNTQRQGAAEWSRENRLIRIEWRPVIQNDQTVALLVLMTDITEYRQLSRNLIESEQYFRSLFERSPFPIATVDEHGEYTLMNRPFSELKGVRCGDRFGSSLSGETAKQAEHLVRKIKEGHANQVLLTIPDSNGRPRELNVATAPIIIDGKSRGAHLIFNDLTDIRRAHRLLVEREQRFRAVVDPNPAAIYTLDLVGRFETINHAVERITGYRGRELVGQPIGKFILDAEKDMVRRHFIDTLSGESRQFTARIVRPSGEIRHVSVTASPLRLDDKIVGVAGISIDITNQALAEQRQRQLTSVMDATSDLVALSDHHGKLIYMNQAGRKLLCISELADISSIAMDRVIPPENRPSPAQCPPNQSREAVVWRGESTLRRRNGQPIPVSQVIICHGEPGANWYSTVARDISERKRNEQRLRQLTVHAQTAREREQQRISRELHDELGQALTALKFDAASLRHLSDLPDAAAPKLQAMGHALDETLNAMRRIARGLRPTALDDLGIIPALEVLLEDFAEHTGVAWTLDAATDDLFVDAELATVIYRVVQEALTNIGRHACADAVQVALEEEHDWLKVTVTDNGVGFDTDSLATGISLGILGMRERIEPLGGRLEIHSERGAGTVLLAHLPLDIATKANKYDD